MEKTPVVLPATVKGSGDVCLGAADSTNTRRMQRGEKGDAVCTGKEFSLRLYSNFLIVFSLCLCLSV